MGRVRRVGRVGGVLEGKTVRCEVRAKDDSNDYHSTLSTCIGKGVRRLYKNVHRILSDLRCEGAVEFPHGKAAPLQAAPAIKPPGAAVVE